MFAASIFTFNYLISLIASLKLAQNNKFRLFQLIELN